MIEQIDNTHFFDHAPGVRLAKYSLDNPLLFQYDAPLSRSRNWGKVPAAGRARKGVEEGP